MTVKTMPGKIANARVRLWPAMTGFITVAILLVCHCNAWTANVTLLVPSQSTIDLPPNSKKQPLAQTVATQGQKAEAKPEQAARAGAGAGAATANQPKEGPDGVGEVDVLITMMRPESSTGLDMEMPQLFAVVRHDDSGNPPQRHDLLGDVEEIRFLGERAWGANVALTSPGLYQFMLEGRPWWDESRQAFLQHYVKTVVPVHNVAAGWDKTVGLLLEIQPLVRPFGLTAPVIFRARALFNGQAMANAPVFLHSVTAEARKLPSHWHASQEGRTNASGEFAFVLDRAGWWCCMATMPGDSLKGPGGTPRERELAAVFWLYVDGPGGK